MGQDITLTSGNNLALANEQATLDAGATFARHLQAGINVYLHGNLGAGKTTFVRGMLIGLGFFGKVKSPTYTLVESYQLKTQETLVDFYHFDLYRFLDEDEWEAAGFREYFNTHSVCLVEWPEKAGPQRPAADLALHIESMDEQQRQVQMVGLSAKGQRMLEGL